MAERAANTFDHFSQKAGTSTMMIAKLREMSADLGVSFRSLAGGGAQLMMKGFTRQVLGVRIEDVRKEMEAGNVTWVELGKALDKPDFGCLRRRQFSPHNALDQSARVVDSPLQKRLIAGSIASNCSPSFCAGNIFGNCV